MSFLMTEEKQVCGYKWWQWVLGALCVLPLIPMLIGVLVPKTRRILTPLVIWIGYAVLLVVFIVVSASLSESEQNTSSAQGRQNIQVTQPTTTGATSAPTIVIEPTPARSVSLRPGMYQVGNGIEPRIYAGLAGTEIFSSCYWARLSGASGDFSEILSNENAVGQFYVEIQPNDKYFKVDCEITPLKDWPTPSEPLSELGPGMYLVGRDIKPGTYQGMAGTDVTDSCYWARLSGLSGDMNHLIANDNAIGSYFVTVNSSDSALTTACTLSLTR